jgi:periplasmic divalent cation tolerance protein
MILVYITCESKKKAIEMGKHLLKNRLCACVNIFEKMTPIYWWPPKANKLYQDKEVVLVVKTLVQKFEQIEKEVFKINKDEISCIFSIPVGKVSKPYFGWLAGEIK